MPRIQGQQLVVMVAGGLQRLGVENTIQVTRSTEGRMEADVVFGPTEDLTQAAVFVASLGLVLHYDGSRIRVLSREGSSPVEGNDLVITSSALVVAEQAGLDLAALFAADIGTGLNGRILKEDVLAYIDRLTNPPQPPPAPPTLQRVEISQQPGTTAVHAVISPPPLVHLFDNSGAAFDTAVTVALGANPGGGALTGTLAVNSSGGAASFSDLAIDKPGSGYTLIVRAGNIAIETSPFQIVAAAAARGYAGR